LSYKNNQERTTENRHKEIRSDFSPQSFDANQIRLASAEGLATPLNA